jgi:two-component system response regulator YesN
MLKAILLDDEHLVLKWLESLIGQSDLGLSVIATAKNGEDGLRLIKKYNPDIVITDIRMPKLDGLELIKAVTEIGYPVKFVILSGYGEFEYAKLALQYGVKDYLLKPVSGDQMKKTILNVVNALIEEQEDKLRMEKIRNDAAAVPEHIKNEIYQDVLLDIPIEENKILQYNEMFTINEYSLYQVVSMYLLYNTETSREENAYAEIYEMIKQKIDEFFTGSEFFYTPIIKSADEIVLIICCNSKDVPIRIRNKELQKIIRSFVAAVKNSFETPLIAGIGNFYAGLKGIKTSYEEAYRAVGYANPEGEGYCVHINELFDRADKVKYPIELENNLMDAIKYTDREKAKYILTGILNKILSNEICTILQFRTICMEIAAVSLRLLYSLGIKTDELSPEIHEIMRSLAYSTRFDIIKKQIVTIVDEEISLLEKKNDRAYSKIINQILQFISQKIAMDLSVNSLARLVRITPGYLSTLFKREVGMSPVKYITNARIEKAKQLLLNPELKIHEISLMVGYQDAKYFSHIFKDKTGLLPCDYRINGY